ncbi:MAG: Glycosyl transferase family 2 [Microgenomates group bacterium GW2011_GWA1_48_10]|nr:MAG: Glycosyl transferase family 2 [Microgenomates group bacterium GW2011_GWA1_48_10]
MNIVIVMPTFNEGPNIARMIDILTKDVFPKIKHHHLTLLVVDSHSPDGTWKIVQEKSKTNRSVVLLDEGGKYGLGKAYIDGFNYAIRKLKADAVMEMDGDLQHNPHDIPRFVTEFAKGADYIVGSRYIAGGSIPSEWGLDRKLLSIVGNLIYQTSLFMWDIHDFTTGFRLARVRGFLDTIEFEKVFSKSFAYKTRLLYEMKKRGAKIKEIPIKFNLRLSGDSKMTTNTFTESLKVIAVIWADRLGLTK